MNILELRAAIDELPDHVKIYVTADHGQTAIQFGGVMYTDEEDLPYYAEDAEWHQHEENLEGPLTAILLTD